MAKLASWLTDTQVEPAKVAHQSGLEIAIDGIATAAPVLISAALVAGAVALLVYRLKVRTVAVKIVSFAVRASGKFAADVRKETARANGETQETLRTTE